MDLLWKQLGTRENPSSSQLQPPLPRWTDLASHKGSPKKTCAHRPKEGLLSEGFAGMPWVQLHETGVFNLARNGYYQWHLEHLQIAARTPNFSGPKGHIDIRTITLGLQAAPSKSYLYTSAPKQALFLTWSPTLGLQIAQGRSYVHTLGPKVGTIYALGALGLG